MYSLISRQIVLGLHLFNPSSRLDSADSGHGAVAALHSDLRKSQPCVHGIMADESPADDAEIEVRRSGVADEMLRQTRIG